MKFIFIEIKWVKSPSTILLMMKSYFTRTEPNFIFSDIRIKKILNKEKIKHFILKGSRLDNETFYKDIYRLRRSSYIQYRNNLVICKYFLNFKMNLQ